MPDCKCICPDCRHHQHSTHVVVHVQPTDPVSVGREIQRILRQLTRGNGGA